MTAVSDATKIKVYEKRSTMKTTIAKMIAFHESPAALSALTPPPIFIRIRQDDRTSMTDGELAFTLWFGFIPVRWRVRHEAGPIETSFADRMLDGPMAHWYHQHIFNEVDGGVELVDRLEIAHQSGWKGLLTRLAFDGIPLRILFFYRHLRTRMAVSQG